VTNFISSFLLHKSAKCDDMHRWRKESRFVLYNVLCSDSANATKGQYMSRHYYQPSCDAVTEALQVEAPPPSSHITSGHVSVKLSPEALGFLKK